MVGELKSVLREDEVRKTGQRFYLWLMIVSMIMLFAAFTSAMIVRKGQGNWSDFELPKQFQISTLIVLLSSLPMWMAYRSAKRDDIIKVKIGLSLSLVLGIAFVLSQYLGWQDMYSRGIVFSPSGEQTDLGGISGSYVILIAAVHLIHILGGIIFLTVVLIKSIMKKVHKKNLLSIAMCNTYWHFVGFLWVYLFLFLYFAPQL